MPFLSNMIVHPVALGRACLWPFVQVIAGYAALLSSLYLLVGLDPTVPQDDCNVRKFDRRGG